MPSKRKGAPDPATPSSSKRSKAPAPASQPNMPPGAKKRKPLRKKTQPADPETLENHVRTKKASGLTSENTSTTYGGYVKNGKEYLQQLVVQKRAALAGNAARGVEGLTMEGGPAVVDKDDLAVMEKAFDNPPNRYSTFVLELFIAQKVFEEGLKPGTGISIYSAFKKYWDMMDSRGKFRGPYQCDEVTGTVTGNPADSAEVQDLYRTLQNSKKSGMGGFRDHAEAITIEALRKIMTWSEELVPSVPEAEMKAKYADESQETLLFVLKHLMMRAYMSTAFTLWTRNSELCDLKRGDILLNCVGEEPHCIPHDKINLSQRKGWTRQKGGEHAAAGHQYNIYDQPDKHEINMYFHLRRYLGFMENVYLKGRPLEKDEYVFPKIGGTNGVPYMREPMDHDAVGKYVNEFASAVGITIQYSSHCFRRGGAQYRFMYAPLGERWSLSVIRWWGGWAEGEHNDTLIRYLLDELTTYEKDHADALSPLQRDVVKSFNGDHQRMAPASSEEVRLLVLTVQRQYEKTETTLNTLASKVGSLEGALGGLTVVDSGEGQLVVAGARIHYQSLAGASTFTDLHGPRTSFPPAAGPSQAHGVPVVVPSANQFQHTSPLSGGSQTVQRVINGTVIQSLARLPPQASGSKRQIPYPDAVMKNLPRGAAGWKEAVRQWNSAEDQQSKKAVKDWPKEWYTGEMRLVNQQKRHERFLINREYERCDKDDVKFLTEYPEAAKSIKLLLKAINDAQAPECLTTFPPTLIIADSTTSIAGMTRNTKRLWEKLDPAAQEIQLREFTLDSFLRQAKETKSVREPPRTYRLGVDIGVWFLHAAKAHNENPQGQVNTEMEFIFRLLAQYLKLAVQLVFVVDGPHCSARERMMSTRVFKTADQLEKVRGLVLAFGFQWHQAPGEATAELARMNVLGLVDAVLTDDSDTLVYGAEVVVRNPLHLGPRNSDAYTLMVTRTSIQEPYLEGGVGFDRGALVLFKLLYGSDFDPPGLKGCGHRLAASVARCGLGLALVVFFGKRRRSAGDPIVQDFLHSWKQQLSDCLANDPFDYIGQRNLKLAQEIPPAFPDVEVINSLLHPLVSSDNTLRREFPSSGMLPSGTAVFQYLVSSAIDAHEIRQLCMEHCNWSLAETRKNFKGSNAVWQGVAFRRTLQERIFRCLLGNPEV
ncbi:hypothetical protein EIP91_010837, partial [Steccherinum ochraceum]